MLSSERIMFVANHSILGMKWAGFQWLAYSAASNGATVHFTDVSYRSFGEPRQAESDVINPRLDGLSSLSQNRVACSFPLYNLQVVNAVPWYTELIVWLLARQIDDVITGFSPDLIVVENGLPAACLAKLRKVTNARIIVRMSDLSIVFSLNKRLIALEKQALARADKISLPSEHMFAYLGDDLVDRVEVVSQGVPKAELLFAQNQSSPFIDEDVRKGFEVNVVYMGTTLLDVRVVKLLSDRFPEVGFHYFTDKELPISKNIVSHGIQSLGCISRYLFHSNCCFVSYKAKYGNSYIVESSNKIKICEFIGLPYIYPNLGVTLDSEISVRYDIEYENSLFQALEAALRMERRGLNSEVNDWCDVLYQIIR